MDGARALLQQLEDAHPDGVPHRAEQLGLGLVQRNPH